MRRRPFGALLLALAVAGCACANPANTPLLTELDSLVQPETLWGKIAWGPIFVPVGVACGVLDICVVHPVRATWFGAEDAWEIVWARPKGTFVEQAVLFVPKVAVTPVVFAVCWAGESLFDLRPAQEDGPR